MRRCLSCRALSFGSYCVPCQRRRKAFRNAEAERCWVAVDAHRREFGDWCPGYGVPPHPSNDLTADHVDPRQPGGRLVVRCRSCNSRKGGR